ncbi:hypothetical protein FDI59_gp108 [Mycobacterium phage Yoshi]|uniref:Uncharacterized protein n=1 Tax=Mycobacterium phage Yoshi TaxID=2920891 RepID=G1BSL5_9CAUD|nr:hypothetical protein FDI59_gp108 [Mycobacterium phage Yoshi]AEK07855.1 hypothetical protein YOSHI_108 [Mycobacterium phage Yoshi]
MSDFTEIGKAAAKVFEDGIRAMIAQELDARGVKGPVVNNINVGTLTASEAAAEYVEMQQREGGYGAAGVARGL